MFDPLFLIVVLLIGPGLLLLIGIVVMFALRIKSPDQWPKSKTDTVVVKSIPPQDVDV